LNALKLIKKQAKQPSFSSFGQSTEKNNNPEIHYEYKMSSSFETEREPHPSARPLSPTGKTHNA